MVTGVLTQHGKHVAQLVLTGSMNVMCLMRGRDVTCVMTRSPYQVLTVALPMLPHGRG